MNAKCKHFFESLSIVHQKNSDLFLFLNETTLWHLYASETKRALSRSVFIAIHRWCVGIAAEPVFYLQHQVNHHSIIKHLVTTSFAVVIFTT